VSLEKIEEIARNFSEVCLEIRRFREATGEYCCEHLSCSEAMNGEHNGTEKLPFCERESSKHYALWAFLYYEGLIKGKQLEIPKAAIFNKVFNKSISGYQQIMTHPLAPMIRCPS